MSSARNLASLGNQNTLAVETGATEVGIASTAPSSTLDVRGEVKIGTNIQLGNAGVITASSYSGSFPIVDASSLAVSGISTLVRLAVTDEVVTGIITALGLSGNLTGAAATISGALNVDGTTDSTSVSTGALIVDGGVGIAKNVYIGAGLSVAGTLTYEDVTSVDSVGMVTAKSGVNITGGQFTVGSGITMGIAGVATFSGTSDVHLLDNVQLNVGDSSDLVIKHDGSNSWITNTTGNLILKDTTDSVYIQAPSVRIQDDTTNEDIAKFISDGAVELYYDNSKKFETTNDGTVTTGIATATGGVAINADSKNLTIGAGEDLKLYHNGSHSYADNGTGSLFVRSDNQIYFQATNGDRYADFVDGGAVKLYYSNAAENKKFETTNDGTVTTGIATVDALRLGDNEYISVGAGSTGDLQLSHNGTDSIIQNNTGNLEIRASEFRLRTVTSETIMQASINGEVQLWYDNNEKFRTTYEGSKITGFTSTTAGMGVTGGLYEGSFIKAGKLSDNKTLGISTANFFYFTTQETTTATPNIIWNDSYSLSSKMAVGDVVSVTVVTTAAAGGYSANWHIDGNAVTEEWVGGSAPSAGGSDGLDIYSLTIIKTGTGTGDSGFKVIANVSNAT